MKQKMLGMMIKNLACCKCNIIFPQFYVYRKHILSLAQPAINEEYVAQLMDMGFPLEACKKAVHFTNNQGAVFTHICCPV